MTPDYDYWEKALADPKALQRREFRITSDPQPGFYRNRHGRAVAIWQDGDTVAMLIDGIPVDPDEQETVWLNCATRPVSEEWYRIVDDGGVWPDLDATVAGIGDNRRGADIEGLIRDLAWQAETYEAPESDEEAQRAISLRAAILEQHKRADREREADKAPHLKAAKAVDEVWMPMVKLAKGAADRLRSLVEGWETKKRKAAREAEAARIAAGMAGKEPMVLEDFPPVCVPPQDQIRSGYGRAASVREKQVVTALGNLQMLFNHYRDDERLYEAMFAMAQADVDRGITVPGVSVETQAVIR